MRRCRGCLTVAKPRQRKCGACGRKLPVKRKPAHMNALELSYQDFIELNGGIEECGICGSPPKTRRLHRDHDHRTGVPRGLLCFPCNAAIRPYMTLEWLRAALSYIERSSA